LFQSEEPVVENGDRSILGLDGAAFHTSNRAHEFHIGADALAEGMDVLQAVGGR
jgi:hypothetical protein